MTRSKLALVDGHAVAFRAFHALREADLRASSGEPTFAVFGFCQILLTTLQQLQPDYAAVAFDVGRTFRDDLFAEYKANRTEAPEDFHGQLEQIKRIVRALNIPIYEVEGYEADDVIGTLAQQATAQDVDTYIITGDTDTLQLVNDHVRVLLAVPYGKKQEAKEYDLAAVIERYKGLQPHQLADLRGLKGDVSDNIPGVKGIGEAGAIALLNQFGSIAGIYDRFDEVPNRYKKPLDGQRDTALFSKDLATIRCDTPARLDLPASRLAGYNRDDVIAIFQELQFGSLVRKLPPSDGMTHESPESAHESSPARPGSDSPAQMGLFDGGEVDSGRPTPLVSRAATPVAHGDYGVVRTQEDLAALVRELESAPSFAFDTETTALSVRDAELVGLSFATAPGRAWYVPIAHKGDNIGEQLGPEQVRESLLPLLEDGAQPKIAHNGKFDILALRKLDMDVRGLGFDTMIAAQLLGNNGIGLKDLAFNVLKVEMTEITDLIGTGKKQISFDRVPIEQAAPYAAADADMTLRLRDRLDQELDRVPRIRSIFESIEMPLLPVLADMEWHGIKVDVDVLRQLSAILSQRIGEIESRMFEIAGAPFNPGSGQQLNQILFEQLGVTTSGLSKTKTGLYSITAEVLDKLSGEHEIIDLILEHRQLTKLKSTYIDTLPGLVDRNGRVHTEYKQIGAATGRLACLPAGTLVNTERGLVGIETVRPGEFIRTPYGPRRVLAWEATGEKPVIVLRLSNGIVLRCSPEHHIRSRGAWLEARQLEVGAPVYMSFSEGLFGDEVALNLAVSGAYTTQKTPLLPSEWSVALAELVGYLLADGHLARSNYNGKPAKMVLAFGWDDDELIEHFAAGITQLFGKTPVHRITRTCPVLEVSSVDIAGALAQLGAGAQSGAIRVPRSLYHAPKAIVAAFLRGYFEGDGGAHKTVLQVRSTSRAMLEDVQQLLTLFGIPSTLVDGQPDPRGYAPRFTLRIKGDRSKVLFARDIGFLSRRKQQALQSLIERRKHLSSAELLTPPAMFEMAALKPVLYAAHRGADGGLPQALTVFTSKHARAQHQISLARMEWIAQSLPPGFVTDEVLFVQEAVAAQYYEVQIVDIQHEAPAPMYDIAVADVEQYMAQGIVVHNSANPNLQNIPVRTEQGREIRRAFIAEQGCYLLAADYSQIELRLLAHITQDPALLETFREGRDIHAATAARLFGVPINQVTRNQRRIAKCVAAGTLVNTSRGIVPIEQLGCADPGAVAPLTIEVAQEGVSRALATGFYNDGIQPTIRITTERGYVLEATPQHRVRSLDEHGAYIWRELENLDSGMYVALARGAMLFGEDRPFNICFDRRQNYQVMLPERMTPAFSRFLGYFVAEGNIIHGATSSSLFIHNADPDVLCDLRQISLEVFGVYPREAVDRNGVTKLSWHISRLVDLVEHLGVGAGAAHKRIPDVIMQGSYKTAAHFLRGFFEGDGSISGSYISAASKSSMLIHQLQTLLLNFGIVCYREHRDVPGYGRHYKLRLLGKESREIFAKHIGFVSRRKQQRLDLSLTRKVTNEPVTLPLQQRRLMRLYDQTTSQLKETIHTCIRTKSPPVGLTYRRLSTIIDAFPHPQDADVQTLRAHHQRNLFYDRVKTIERTHNQVYDLVVPETNTYIANGFVSHNTTVFGTIYGISSFGLAARTDLSRDEAQQLINGLFETYPGIKRVFDETLEFGRQHGYVETLFGRRRYFGSGSSNALNSKGPGRAAAEREAKNAPIQGTSADLIKMAMIKLDHELRQRGLSAKMLLQVHDELLLEVPDDELDEVKKLVCDVMENIYPDLSVPLEVEVSTGRNWEEMK